MNFHLKRRAAGLILALGVLTVSMIGCSDSTTTPRDTFTDSPALLSRPVAKITGTESESIADSAEVDNALGGSVEVGDETIGHSGVDLPADAFADDSDVTKIKLVKVKVTRIGEVTAELGPDGLEFKKPVWLSLSYKGADLTGVDESKLVVMYYNESFEPPVWEVVVGSVVDVDKKTVKAPLAHFSRYGIGSDE